MGITFLKLIRHSNPRMIFWKILCVSGDKKPVVYLGHGLIPFGTNLIYEFIGVDWMVLPKAKGIIILLVCLFQKLGNGLPDSIRSGDLFLLTILLEFQELALRKINSDSHNDT